MPRREMTMGPRTHGVPEGCVVNFYCVVNYKGGQWVVFVPAWCWQWAVFLPAWYGQWVVFLPAWYGQWVVFLHAWYGQWVVSLPAWYGQWVVSRWTIERRKMRWA